MRQILPLVVALCDTIAIAAYVIGIEPMIVQGAALGVKLLLLPMLLRSDSMALAGAPLLFVMILASLVSLVFSTSDEMLPIIQTMTFFLHLTLTLLLVPREIGPYLRAVSYIVAVASALFILMALAGQVPVVWDRYHYFHGTHPNLGAEIAAMGAICAAMALKTRPFLIASAPMLVSSLMLQGRAAILAIAAVIGMKMARWLYLAAKSHRQRLWIVIAGPIILVALLFSLPMILDAMRLDDAYRGAGTGLVGRTERWGLAWSDFLDHPLTGIGLGGSTASEELTPHNFFLYGLSEMGMMFAPIVFALLYMSVRARRNYGWTALYLAPVTLLLVMNDRFMNLNLYPFLVYFLLFALQVPASAGPAPAQAEPAAAPARQRARGRRLSRPEPAS